MKVSFSTQAKPSAFFNLLLGPSETSVFSVTTLCESWLNYMAPRHGLARKSEILSQCLL